MNRPALLLGAAALLLTGCASAPTRFHTLDPLAPDAAPPAVAVAVPVRLDSVTLPAELDRPEIVRRAGPGSLEVAESDRWAGPLDAVARHVLASDLAERLPAGAVIRPDDPAPPRRLRHLDVEIERFEGDAGRVTLVAHWILFDADSGRAALRRDVQIESPIDGSSIDATVTGMSRAMASLADRIAAVAGQ